MREQILAIIEKNSRIDIHELAVILGVEEIDVANELKAMEEEGIICGYHTMGKNLYRKGDGTDRGKDHSPEGSGL